jgi:hypothetical protein
LRASRGFPFCVCAWLYFNTIAVNG